MANRPFYAAIGVDLSGHRDVLGLWAGTAGDGESAKFWLSVLTEIKNRGAGDVFFLVCDGLKGLPDAVGAVFPEAIVQTCIIDLIRGTFRYASKKYWSQIAHDLKPVYTAPSPKAAWAAFEEFEDKWARPYPAIGKLWRAAWQQFIPFLDYDVEIRRVLCSTNAIESLWRPIPQGGERQGPLSDRAGGTEDAVSGDPIAGPEGHRAPAMGHAVETGAQRVCRDLRRPDARGREPLTMNASYTVNRTLPQGTRSATLAVVSTLRFARVVSS